jgi:hypothetical protein
MLNTMPRRILVTMALAASLLLSSAPAYADSPVQPNIPLDGIGPVSWILQILGALPLEPEPQA